MVLSSQIRLFVLLNTLYYEKKRGIDEIILRNPIKDYIYIYINLFIWTGHIMEAHEKPRWKCIEQFKNSVFTFYLNALYYENTWEV